MIVFSIAMGLGDISASTTVGRLVVILIIVIGILLFADKTSELISIAQEARAVSAFHKRRRAPFVLLTGQPSFKAVMDFLQLIFNSDNIVSFRDRDRQVCILMENDDAYQYVS